MPDSDDNSISLAALQRSVDDWIAQHGVRYFGELTNLAQLIEEVGELARLLSRAHGEQSFRRGTEPESIPEAVADEMADVLFVLVCLANQTGTDLTAAVQRNLEKKTVRDATRHRENPKLNPPG